jgi:hypothetical protein
MERLQAAENSIKTSEEVIDNEREHRKTSSKEMKA